MITDTWAGCYGRGWGQELVPEAFQHPAKVSFLLAERIYAHVATEGWAEPGSTVIDPFGGIAGFAYHALFAGLVAMPSLKGVHLAVQSGMMIAKTALEAFKNNDTSLKQLSLYEELFKKSPVYRELYPVRNFRQSFKKNLFQF